jgi:hypothetical protein
MSISNYFNHCQVNQSIGLRKFSEENYFTKTVVDGDKGKK